MPRWFVPEGDAAESSSEEEEEEQEDVDDAEDEEQEQDGAAAKSAGRSRIKVSLKQNNSDVCHVSCWPKNVVCMHIETDDYASAHGQHGQSDAQTHSKMRYAVLMERAHAHIAAWLSALTFMSDRSPLTGCLLAAGLWQEWALSGLHRWRSVYLDHTCTH